MEHFRALFHVSERCVECLARRIPRQNGELRICRVDAAEDWGVDGCGGGLPLQEGLLGIVALPCPGSFVRVRV